jgi:SAM-dependent methyltransferase
MTFDSMAAQYDAEFTQTPIAAHLRARTQQRLRAHWGAGAQVLELGGGTAEDAFHLAQGCVYVAYTDASPAMLATARAKFDDQPLISLSTLDLNALPSAGFADYLYDGVLANFGALNVVRDLPALATWLAARVRTGGRACFGVMARYCLWETLWHGLHLDKRTATRRWGGQTTFSPTAGVSLPIYYWTVAQFSRAFAVGWRRVHVEPLGLWLPPSDVYGVLLRRPRVQAWLMRLDDTLGRATWAADLADHFWIEFERV